MNDDQKKGEVLSAIEKMMDRYPDWRIGQLVSNVATWSRGPQAESIWDMENEEFVAAVDEHLKS